MNFERLYANNITKTAYIDLRKSQELGQNIKFA